jgi:hypothetical protein
MSNEELRAMEKQAAPTGRDRAEGPNRRGRGSGRGGQRPAETPEPWDAEQIAFARDLAVLIDRGLIAPIGDGPDVRYAVIHGAEVL